MPRINDTSSGLMRRLMMIPFNAKFSASDPDYDPFIQDKLISDESMQYVLNLAIDGLKRLLKNKKFSPSKTIEKEISNYEVQNNPILGFLQDTDTKVENEVTGDVFRLYQVWCADNGYQHVAANTFTREMNRILGFETKVQKIDGKSKRVFVSNKK